MDEPMRERTEAEKAARKKEKRAEARKRKNQNRDEEARKARNHKNNLRKEGKEIERDLEFLRAGGIDHDDEDEDDDDEYTPAHSQLPDAMNSSMMLRRRNVQSGGQAQNGEPVLSTPSHFSSIFDGNWNMDEFCSRTLSTLNAPIDNDPIQKCGAEALGLLETDLSAALAFADGKLRVFPFKDVETCWRRLYADASILKAISLIQESAKAGSAASASDDEPKEAEWLTEIVRLLDMALIMTGAPLREEMIEDFFTKLQALIEEPENEENGRAKKRQKLDSDIPSTFKTEPHREPELLFPIPRSAISLSGFEKILETKGSAVTPHIITNALSHWPSLSTRPWNNPSYLLQKTLGGRRLIPIELGRAYTDVDWSQRIVSFSQFLTDYILSPSLSSSTEGIGYLAQHDLFAQIPSLRADISVPDYCYTDPPSPEPGTPLSGKEVKRLEDVLINAWFGPAGTISPLHTDPYHNILCQVVGSKYVRLYCPRQTGKLYPRGTETNSEGKEIDMSNTSRVPVERVEMGEAVVDEDGEDEFELFEEAEYVETVLKEGECLYIPVGWWHYVRSLEVSFSVSFWWN